VFRRYARVESASRGREKRDRELARRTLSPFYLGRLKIMYSRVVSN